jgi:hypothetical protein
VLDQNDSPQVAELIEQKHLVRTRVYAPIDPDLRGVETRVGDYVETQLAARMDRPKLVGDIVTHWHKYSERRKTVCFAVNVEHSIHIRDEFIKSGVRAEHVDGSTPKPERDAALERLASGAIEVVTNCMVLTEGWDMPEIGCAILARPTRKMGLYRQMVGRILRPAEGKSDAIVLDHSGAVYRHGFVEDHVEWMLDPERRSESAAHAARCEPFSASRMIECSQCGVMATAGEPCWHCGFLPQRPARGIPFRDGDLSLVDRNGRATRNADRDRSGARLQPRMDFPQGQRKIRQLAALRRDRRADHPDTGMPGVGALAHDRLRQRRGGAQQSDGWVIPRENCSRIKAVGRAACLGDSRMIRWPRQGPAAARFPPAPGAPGALVDHGAPGAPAGENHGHCPLTDTNSCL